MKGRRLKKGPALLVVVVITMIIFACSFASGGLSKDDEKVEVKEDSSIILETINRDLVNDYPETAIDVVDFYADMTKCIHSEGITDEEIKLVAKKC